MLTSDEAGPSYLMPVGVDNVYSDVRRWRWGLARQVRQVAAEVPARCAAHPVSVGGLRPAPGHQPVAGRAAWPRPAAEGGGHTFHDLRTPYIFPKAGPSRWRGSIWRWRRRPDAVIVTNAEDLNRISAVQALAGKLHEAPIGANIQPDPPEGFQR